MKRNVPPEMLGRPSPYHSSVTLFEPAADSPRRSKRIKVKEETETETEVSIPVPKALVQTTSTKRCVKNTALKVEETDISEVKPPALRSTAGASPRKAKPIPQSLAVPHPAPLRWKEAYDAIQSMRENIAAPVDTMGCDQAQYKETDPKNRRFATLVSLMLSSQTKDEVTNAAVLKLRDAVGGTLSVQAVLDANDDVISGAIAKVGFWRRKTQYIKQTAWKLHDDFGSDVPKTVDELCSLPGVGPKMAFLCLQVAWNINAGIGVDVHVHRITNRLGWHKPPTKNPEETRLNLQSWLPKELHREINHMLVGFGQMTCLPVGPRCTSCDLSSGLCPSASKGTKSKVKREKMTKTLTESSLMSSGSAGPKLDIEIEQEEIKLEKLED